MAHDPVVDPVVSDAENLEPHFVHEAQEARAAERLAATTATVERPNVLVILFDDVGWGDFGCYGGGVGRRRADAQHRPARPTRAAPHVVLLGAVVHAVARLADDRPAPDAPRAPAAADVRRAGRARRARSRSPSCSSDAGYVTQAVGKWHMGENPDSQPQHVGFDDFYGFLVVSDMYTRVARPLLLPRGRRTPRSGRSGSRTSRSTSASCTPRGAVRSRRSRRSRSRCSRCSTTSGPATPSTSCAAMARRRDSRGSCYHCTRGAHFDNYPLQRFLGTSPAKHPYKDTSSSSTTSWAGSSRRSRRPVSSTTR